MIASPYRHIFAAVGLVFHLVLCCVVLAGDPCEVKAQCSCSASSGECDTDYSELVSSLANRNSRPVFVGKDEKRRPLFPDNYDWKEERRVQNVLHQILKYTDHALPTLLDHFDDDRFCVTLDHGDYVLNHSVGSICSAIVRESLIKPFTDCLSSDQGRWRELWNPECLKKTPLEKWCRERLNQGDTFVEMQNELLQWAINNVPDASKVTAKEREDVISKMTSQLAMLKDSKAPILKTRFFKDN